MDRRRGRPDPASPIRIFENAEGFLLVTAPVAGCLAGVELAIDWNEVEITLPPDERGVHPPRRHRVRLPAAIDPRRSGLVHLGDALLLCLARRTSEPPAARRPTSA